LSAETRSRRLVRSRTCAVKRTSGP
jgi:hypothetical protein